MPLAVLGKLNAPRKPGLRARQLENATGAGWRNFGGNYPPRPGNSTIRRSRGSLHPADILPLGSLRYGGLAWRRAEPRA